jgi:hypothetical protein
MSFGEIVFAMVISGIVGLWVYAYIVSEVGDIRRILWDNTAIGWGWRKLFGEKKKAKQAPNNVNPAWYVPPPGIRKGMISNTYNPPMPQPTTFNTSSNFIKPNSIGKPLVIQNWDRLIGMIFPISISNSAYGNWIVTHAGQTTDGYECMFENGGGFGNSNRAVTLTVYSDIYDSNRVMVKCGGRISTMDIDVFKDPNNMLYRISQEFSEKFR